MRLYPKPPKQVLNKAYLKEKVGRDEIELFKKNFSRMLSRIDEDESEEHGKNIVADFLKNTYYKELYEINTKDRKDLVIHTGKTAKDAVGVILEVKKPKNKGEMVSATKPNAKALQELILYYLRERIDGGNKFIRHLVITNIWEWYIIDERWAEQYIHSNARLRKDYEDFKQSGKKTDFFYDSIARPFIDSLDAEIPCAYFDIRDYEKIIANADKADDNKLIAFYKILSPVHLLKEKFANDSNSLDKGFYEELLHIIGLEEVKDGGKKLIQRKKKSDDASLLENTIAKLEERDSIYKLPNPSAYGANKEEQVRNVALELCITWVNRVLFMKLLEAQLAKYHKGDKGYLFLNTGKIHDYDELSNLFFGVLAERPASRKPRLAQKFPTVPYLNSSLFERTELESWALEIALLDNGLLLPIAPHTVLKDDKSKRLTGSLPTLDYLFRFLDAYDFASEGSEEIQEENKNLINASVLGLIFEKINGYKDGSFFTPGFVTMYMCRETLRRAVVEKFNRVMRIGKGDADDAPDRYATLDDIYNAIGRDTDREIANDTINSLTICDPAVGSGHFLVSALNEIIAIKSELRILVDSEGRLLRDVEVTVENDELIVMEDGRLFQYNPQNKESRRVQETLFHEKQTLIENCLFGVDINPNSVKICRLRLWIELLKNAYYTAESNYTELETLPNIDINIKQGNSLVSRFALDADLAPALKSIKWDIADYQGFVRDYKAAKGKEEKRGLEALIDGIKKDFRTEIGKNDPKLKKLAKVSADYYLKYQAEKLFNAKLTPAQSKEKKKLEGEIQKLDGDIQEIKSNKIYEQAFEWRFEFPEVLDAEGRFVGFDVVIGNPPYGALVAEYAKKYFTANYETAQGPFEVYKFFIERGLTLSKANGLLTYITPDTWINLGYFKKLRSLIVTTYKLEYCTETLFDLFNEAKVDNNIYLIKNAHPTSNQFKVYDSRLLFTGFGVIKVEEEDTIITLKAIPALIRKIEEETTPLGEKFEVWRGMSAYGAADPSRPYNSFSKDSELHRKVLNGGDIGKYAIKWNGEYVKYGNWLHRPRPSYIYDTPHLLVQRIRNPRLQERIVATLDNDQYISSDGLSNLISKEGDDEQFLKYTLALLNSRLINYWFGFYFFDVNIKPEQLKRIPLKVGDSEMQENVVAFVDLLLSNPANSLVSQKIEKLVYEIYGLTEEEREILDRPNND